MKIFEHIFNNIAHQIRCNLVLWQAMPSLMPSFHQLQEKYLNKKRTTSFAFVDLDRAFDQVPCAILW